MSENSAVRKLCRSVLYMPASNARALAKLPGLDADAFILDLEDAVAPEQKREARDQAVACLRGQRDASRWHVLRINGCNTPWRNDDIEAVLTARPDAVLLPKVESAAEVAALSAVLDEALQDQQLAIWAMMETPLAILDAAAIARVRLEHPRFQALVIGNNDLARAAGMQVGAEREVQMPWLMQVLAAARAYGLIALDGVFADYHDTQALARECHQAMLMGFDGKTLIHPVQIEIANRAFAPSAAAVDEALRLVQVFDAVAEAEGRLPGVMNVDGRMVEKLHYDMAQALLARQRQIDARQP